MATLDVWLEEFVRKNGGIAGTVHLHADDVLTLAAAYNIPEPVKRVTAIVPRGKGMAGIALAEDRAVTTCNLKTDDSGAVKPGAKAVDGKAAAALPIHRGARIAAVVGIAFADERDLPDAELARLTAACGTMPA